jgi:hypothetical protein
MEKCLIDKAQGQVYLSLPLTSLVFMLKRSVSLSNFSFMETPLLVEIVVSPDNLSWHTDVLR